MNNQSLLLQLSAWVSEQTGIYFPENRWHDLERIINNSSQELGIEDAELYIHQILSSSLTMRQIDVLIKHLTVGETYFFREKRCLEIFENNILPELTGSRQKWSKTLKIWSVGCSSGEEPYSIAIILSKKIPDLRDWNVAIMAADINTYSLSKAANGIYSEWSFRDVPDGFKEKYFKKTSCGRYEILPDIKKMVTFFPINLVKDTNPCRQADIILLPTANCQLPTGFADVIFCRNVLMYFAAEQIKKVVNSLHGRLVDGGYLIVSPTETSNLFDSKFVAVNLPGATIYKKEGRRQDAVSASAVKSAVSSFNDDGRYLFETNHNEGAESRRGQTESVHVVQQIKRIEEKETKTGNDPYSMALDLYQQGCYDEAVNMLQDIISQEKDHVEAVVLLARAYANQGKLDQALEWSNKAIAIDKANHVYHYLNAVILYEQGEIDAVVRPLERALYLDSNFTLANFMLGSILRRQGKINQSDKHLKNALRLLNAYKPEDILPCSEGMTAGRLREIIRSMKDNKLINC